MEGGRVGGGRVGGKGWDGEREKGRIGGVVTLLQRKERTSK